MFQYTKKFFAAPVLEDNEDKIRALRTLNAVLISLLAFLGVMLFGTIFIYVKKAAMALTMLIMVAVLLISRTLALRDRILWASAVLVSGLWCLATVTVWLSGGINTIHSCGYVTLTVVAGMLLGPRAALAVAVVSTITGLGFAALPILDINLSPYYPTPPLAALINLMCYFCLTVPAIWLALRGFNDALSAARQEAKDRKRSEEALRESEEKYRTLFEESTDPVYITTLEGILVDANQAYLDLFGFSKEEARNMEILRMYTDPADRKRFQKEIERKGSLKDYEVTLRKKDGTRIEVLLTSTVRRDKDGTVLGYQGIIRDVTDLKHSEQAMRQSEERYRAVFNNAGVGINMVDQSGKFTHANAALLDMLGYTLEELQQLTPLDITHPDDREATKQPMDAMAEGKGGFWRFEKRYIKKDGGIVWGDLSISFIRDVEGKPYGAVGIIANITERKLAEAARERLQNQLLQSQKMEAIGTLAGGIAHDFNNLLQVILGYSDLLLIKKGSGDLDRKKLEVIQRAARDGADLVSRILTFSRKAESLARPIDLNEEIRKSQELLRRTVPRMIDIHLVLAENLQIIHADPAQMEQILLNLAINAQYAMPDGGQLLIETSNVSLTDEHLRTHLGAKPGHYVLLTVSDTGTGMTPEVLERIFEPFFTTKANSEGTGLGLSMVHGIVTQHGGYIRCYSEPGKGTSFKIYFPVSDRELYSDVELTREMPAFGTETILLVDDDDRIREMGRQMIEMAGYKVLIAKAGEEALEVYSSYKEEIALIILDLIMPGMGGRRCLERLLSTDPDVRVIIASGLSNGLAGENVAQARGFVMKPYDAKDILRAIRKVLDQGHL